MSNIDSAAIASEEPPSSKPNYDSGVSMTTILSRIIGSVVFIVAIILLLDNKRCNDNRIGGVGRGGNERGGNGRRGLEGGNGWGWEGRGGRE